MRKLPALLFIAPVIVAVAVYAAAPTNSPPAAASQDLRLTSNHGFFDGNERVVVYYDHVVVTNVQGRLTCERLTIHLPPEGAADSHPTNAVAETNLDIIYVDNKGRTNHLVGERGIYAYRVVNGVTNETFTFHHATNYTAEGWITGEPLTYDVQKNDFDFGTGVQVQLRVHESGTNGSPLSFPK